MTRYTMDSKGQLITRKVDAPDNSLELCFKDSQNMNTLLDKLSTCRAIIDSCLDVAGACLEFCEQLDIQSDIKDASRDNLRWHITRMRMHARTSELLQTRVEKTAEMV